MADVVNRESPSNDPAYADKTLLISVNTPDFPTVNWIVNPDLSTFPGGIDGYEARYANIVGDLVTYMNVSERAAVDAADAAALLANNRTEASDIPDISSGIGLGERGINSRELFEVFNKRDNYLVNRVAELQAAFDAVKATTGPADNIRAAIPASWLATNTRTRAEAITDYKDDINAGNADT